MQINSMSNTFNPLTEIAKLPEQILQKQIEFSDKLMKMAVTEQVQESSSSGIDFLA